MQVTAYKTVELELECDVEMDDIVGEFGKRADEADETYWRRLIPAVDAITRILGKITDGTIKSVPTGSRELISSRLMAQAERWGIKKA